MRRTPISHGSTNRIRVLFSIGRGSFAASTRFALSNLLSRAGLVTSLSSGLVGGGYNRRYTSSAYDYFSKRLPGRFPFGFPSDRPTFAKATARQTGINSRNNFS